MCPCWTMWLLGEINVEVLVDLQAAVLRVAIDLQEIRSRLGQFRIKLVIPHAVKRVGNVQPLPIQAELEHLRPTFQLVPLYVDALPEQASTPYLSSQLRMRGVANVILADITVQPVRQIEVFVVHRDYKFGNQRWNGA